MALLLAIGLSLRIAGAQGELFLDEIWTLHLIQPVTDPVRIFTIHHDNNHFLNSAWLYALGPAAPPWQLRSLSIALGTLGIAAAGWWGLARAHGAAIVAMLLFAVAYAPVQYGSEARGYAGLILFTLLAFRLTERLLAGDEGRWLLAGAALLGILSHLSMVLALATVGLWAAWVEARRQPHLGRAAAAIAPMFLPTFLLIAPVLLLVGGAMLHHSFVIGMLNPFSAAGFVTSYGLLIRSLTGVPGLGLAMPYLVLPSFALVAGWAWRRELAGKLSLYVIAMVALPAVLFLLRVPNSNQPRYFLVSGVAYLLLVTDLIGIAWDRRLALRLSALVLLLVFVVEDGVFVAHFLKDGRGHYREAVEAMTASGPARYASNDDFRNAMIVDFYAARLGRKATLVKQDEWCAAPPDWYVAYSFSHAAPPAKVTAGPTACPAMFGQPAVYSFWGLSGFQWSLFRREP